jgi:hypothetical protein
MARSGGCLGCLGGCLTKVVLILAAAVAFMYLLTVVLNPWALHIGSRSTPLLYWHGTGTVLAKNGKTYPLYISFYPGKPAGHGGRREGKRWGSDLYGTGWLCVAPGSPERMKISGTMYGGYSSTDNSLFEFRLLEWQNSFTFNYQNRGFFDVAGMFQGPNLVMNRPGEQGISFKSGLLIDNATATLHYASYEEFASACQSMASAPTR